MSQANWFLRPQPKPNANLRLICFPYAGGSASTYISWANHLPENVELIAVQPPGRSTRMFEPPYDEMSPLVDSLLVPFSNILDRPYIIYGHSLGSRVAFELMVQCQKAGLRLPAHFIASGSRAPFIPVREKQIYNLPELEFFSELEKLNGTPKEVLQNEELMKLCLPLLRADFKLADTYCSPKTKINSPVTVLGGSNDEGISHDDLQSWEQLFNNSADVHIIPGDHFFVESNKSQVLQKVNQIIAETMRLPERDLQPSIAANY